ncbi:MAG: histidine phosphatase family protein [Anaerolineae bacterium]|nr:histidine phosphatase family protein [Anaerolineae bacterium]
MGLIYLMRHGESIVNRERRLTCRQFAGDLTERGREQAALAATWLADKGIAVMRASPFDRAQQSAQIIAQQLGLSAQMDDDLREMDCGALEGRTDEDGWTIWRGVFDRWNARDWAATFPDGESYRQAFDRFTRALARVRPDETALLVTHGGITITVVPYVCVNAAALQGERHVENTGFVILEPYGDGRFICRAWNAADHLKTA